MKIRTLTADALLAALSMCVYAIESAVPPLVAVPGVKLGLANAVTLTAIRISFPMHISPFRGIGGCAPKESADFGCDWDFCGTQSPCLLYRETHPAG